MPTNPEDSIEATPLCPGCFYALDGDPDFCPGCNAPLGMAVGFCPYRRIWAMAYIYRRGAERPTSPIILCGMILLMTRIAGEFFPMTFFLGSSDSLYERIGIFILLLCGLSIAAVGTIKTVRNYMAIRTGQIALLSDNNGGPDVQDENSDSKI